jgi:hypothetical protein
MPLDGLRAWIGEVERKLGMRTRVFLVLAVIAIGGAGAAIYLAIDARDSSVSESDVQALQQQLEARIAAGGGGGGGTATAQLEAQLRALRAQVAQLREGEGAAAGTSGGDSTEGGGGNEGGGVGGASTEGGSAGSGSSAAGTSTGSQGKRSRNERLEELLEQTQRQNAKAEREQAEAEKK